MVDSSRFKLDIRTIDLHFDREYLPKTSAKANRGIA